MHMIIGEILHFVQNDNKTTFGMTKYVMLSETKDLKRLPVAFGMTVRAASYLKINKLYTTYIKEIFYG